MIGIAGMAKALSDTVTNKDVNYKHVKELRQSFLDAISGLDYYINGSQNKMPHVLNIGFPNQNNGILLTHLDLAGIAVSTGSACTAGTVDPSHVWQVYMVKIHHVWQNQSALASQNLTLSKKFKNSLKN